MTLAPLVPACAQSATNAVQPLSLADAKRLACERNWDLLAAQSSVDAATAQLLMAKEFWMAVSKQGHRWIHAHIAEARGHGWICQPGLWNKQP